jgi:hypothetical protein
MTARVRWINDNPGASRDEAGYWTSAESRFSISPNYRHTVYPDSYTVRDKADGSKLTHDTVRGCKQWAEDRATSWPRAQEVK